MSQNWNEDEFISVMLSLAYGVTQQQWASIPNMHPHFKLWSGASVLHFKIFVCLRMRFWSKRKVSKNFIWNSWNDFTISVTFISIVKNYRDILSCTSLEITRWNCNRSRPHSGVWPCSECCCTARLCSGAAKGLGVQKACLQPWVSLSLCYMNKVIMLKQVHCSSGGSCEESHGTLSCCHCVSERGRIVLCT